MAHQLHMPQWRGEDGVTAMRSDETRTSAPLVTKMSRIGQCVFNGSCPCFMVAPFVSPCPTPQGAAVLGNTPLDHHQAAVAAAAQRSPQHPAHSRRRRRSVLGGHRSTWRRPPPLPAGAATPLPPRGARLGAGPARVAPDGGIPCAAPPTATAVPSTAAAAARTPPRPPCQTVATTATAAARPRRWPRRLPRRAADGGAAGTAAPSVTPTAERGGAQQRAALARLQPSPPPPRTTAASRAVVVQWHSPAAPTPTATGALRRQTRRPHGGDRALPPLTAPPLLVRGGRAPGGVAPARTPPRDTREPTPSRRPSILAAARAHHGLVPKRGETGGGRRRGSAVADQTLKRTREEGQTPQDVLSREWSTSSVLLHCVMGPPRTYPEGAKGATARSGGGPPGTRHERGERVARAPRRAMPHGTTRQHNIRWLAAMPSHLPSLTTAAPPPPLDPPPPPPHPRCWYPPPPPHPSTSAISSDATTQ